MSDDVRLERMESVYFEEPPWAVGSEIVDGQLYDKDVLVDAALALPDEFRARLNEIYRRPDDIRCWSCRDGVGFMLRERNGHDVLEWVPTGLARVVSEPVAVLCESCAPFVPTKEH